MRTRREKRDARFGCLVFAAVFAAMVVIACRSGDRGRVLPANEETGNSRPQPAHEITTLPVLVVEGDTQSERIQSYWLLGNSDPWHRLGERPIERHVTPSLRRRVLERDGNQCLVCRSAENLNCDHVKALQNGGSNSPANLGTLCHPCHVEKGRLDNSLRKQRNKRERAKDRN